jgi:Galactose oxidase, central domain
MFDPRAGNALEGEIGNISIPDNWSYVNLSATLLMNGKVLFAGGENDGYDFSIRNAWLYDPSTGNLTATGRMTVARSAHAATVLPDGTVLITWGRVSRPKRGAL